jgi:hypothetical protein
MLIRALQSTEIGFCFDEIPPLPPLQVHTDITKFQIFPL